MALPSPHTVPESGPIPRVRTERLVGASIAQMREVDRVMMHDFGISLVQMMENAGRLLADLVRREFLQAHPQHARVTVLAGRGGNGGGALVAARRLAGWGARIAVHLGYPSEALTAVTRGQLAILQRMGVAVHPPESRMPAVPDVIIDGLIGYGLREAPTGHTATLIRWANSVRVPRIALDAPSGVDADSGMASDPSIVASATLMLAPPKRGLTAANAAPFTGACFLGDIGVPRALLERAGLDVTAGDIFAVSDLVRLL